MGLSSGLDTGSIIDSLMAVERLPRQRLSFQQVAAEARKSALSDIQSRLSTLKFAATDLGSAATWVDTQSVSVENDSKLSAIKTSGVGPGTYNFNVTQMASAERRTYAFMSPPSDITLTIGSGATSANVALEAGISLDDAVARINADSNTGVFAVKVGADIVLASRTTGAASTISLSVDGGATEVPASSVVAGKDLQYTVDGGPLQSSSTNTVKNAIPGLDVTFKGMTDATGVSVTVGGPAPDTSAIKTKIKAFVAAYNDAMTVMRSKYEEKGVNSPQNNVDAAKGVLRSDSGLSTIMTTMRMGVSANIAGADPSLTLLSQLGISTGAAAGSGALNQDAIAGKLTFDEAKFDEAYANDPTAIKKILGASGSAFSQTFSSAIDAFSSTGGLLGNRVSQADGTIDAIKTSLERFDLRLSARQALLTKQFQQMEAALSNSKAAGNAFSAQLSGLG